MSYKICKSQIKIFILMIPIILIFVGLVNGACSSGVHTFQAFAQDLAGNLNQSQVEFFVDIQPPTMNITSPINASTINTNTFILNYTYKDCSVWLRINKPSMNNSWTCWYSVNGGSNITTPCNLSDGNDDNNVTIYNLSKSSVSGLVEGSNRIILYGKDGAGNTGNSTITLYLDTMVNATPISPINSTHVATDQNYTANFSDATGLSNATLYIYNSSNNLVYNNTVTFAGNPVKYSLGMIVHLIDGVYKWFHSVFDVLGNKQNTPNRTIVIDTTNPDITWNYPPESSYLGLNNKTFKISASVFDSFLDAVNLTVYNKTSPIYNNFTSGIIVTTQYVNDTLNLSEGNNTVNICGRDSLSSSPVISSKANFIKINETKTTFDTKISRDISLYDSKGTALSFRDYNIITNESWIDNGKHWKTTWVLNELPKDSTFKIIISKNNGKMVLLTDRGVTRVVDDDRNYYWKFDDLENAGFKVTYEQDKNNVNVYVLQGSYNPKLDKGISKFFLDPIVGGLNNYCENVTLLIDTINPSLSILSPENNQDFPNFNGVITIPSIIFVNDTNLNTCWYNITGSQNINKTSISCVNNAYNSFSFVLTNSGDFNENICANDTAGNIYCDSINFSVSPYTGSGSGGPDQYPNLPHYDVNISDLCIYLKDFVSNHTNDGVLSYSQEEINSAKQDVDIKVGFAVSDSYLKNFLANYNVNCNVTINPNNNNTNNQTQPNNPVIKKKSNMIIYLVLILSVFMLIIIIIIYIRSNIKSYLLGIFSEDRKDK